MRLVGNQVSLTGWPLIFALLLCVYLTVVQPFVGGASQRRFVREVSHRHAARVHRYRRTIVLELTLVSVALAIVGLSSQWNLTDIGVRWPHMQGGAAPFTIFGGIGVVLTALLLLWISRVHDPSTPIAGPAQVLLLLPRTTKERRSFGWLAVTAGVCEELLYRGFFLAVLSAVVTGLTAWGAVVVGGVAFGLAHIYQGIGGMLTTGVLGSCLAVLYLGSGSLLLPVCYHTLIDLRMLALGGTGSNPRHRR